jgi:dipeptidyl aminopeptidase/acylaminoacyl peptidase
MGYECVVVDGVERCGVPSPDGIWSLQHRNQRPSTNASGFTTDRTDVWVVNLDSGAEHLALEGYVHCGGCDGAYGPRWSPGGQFVVFAETGGEGRRFLTEAATGATQQIGNGQGIGAAPDWSPDGRLLLYPDAFEGPATLIDVRTGTAETLDLAWPAAFDESGQYVYSPAWAAGRPKDDGPVPATTVMDVETRETVYTMSGAPSWTYVWTDEVALMDTPIGTVAALQEAAACDGTAIYVDGVLAECVEDGVRGQVGPTGLVAVARRVATRGPAEGPGFGTSAIYEFEILIVDPGNSTMVVSTGLYGLDVAPYMGWDESGTRLLIRQPYYVGL